MAKEFASFMDQIREEPLEKRIDEIVDILTKVMTIVVSAIDDINQKIASLDFNFRNMQNANLQMGREIQEIRAKGVTATGTPIVSAVSQTPQTPAVQAAPKIEAPPANPVSARSAINSELKSLFSRKKKE